MSAFLDSLASGLDAASTGQAHATLAAVLEAGLPGPRSERWRYSALRALDRRRFDPVRPSEAVPAYDPGVIAHVPAPRVVFVNGVLDAAASDRPSAASGMSIRSTAQTQDVALASGRARAPVHAPDDVFARLNGLLATDGVDVDVASGVHAGEVLHLVSLSVPAPEDRATHLRHRVRVARGASMTLVEHHIASGGHRHFGNVAVDVDLAADAAMTHVRVQDEDAGATLVARSSVRLDDRTRYTRLDLELGAAMSRNELNLELAGVGAHAACNGVLLGMGTRHLDTRLDVQHRGRDGACDLNWRGLAAGRSRAAFHGGITIHAGADGTQARLSNKNLLLSDAAEIDTQPVLVIHADEVQAAHGATVGQLDAGALFYLRSRGIPREAARAMLTNAFCRETLSVIADPGVHAMLDAHLSRALGQAGA